MTDPPTDRPEQSSEAEASALKRRRQHWPGEWARISWIRFADDVLCCVTPPLASCVHGPGGSTGAQNWMAGGDSSFSRPLVMLTHTRCRHDKSSHIMTGQPLWTSLDLTCLSCRHKYTTSPFSSPGLDGATGLLWEAPVSRRRTCLRMYHQAYERSEHPACRRPWMAGWLAPSRPHRSLVICRNTTSLQATDDLLARWDPHREKVRPASKVQQPRPISVPSTLRNMHYAVCRCHMDTVRLP